MWAFNHWSNERQVLAVIGLFLSALAFPVYRRLAARLAVQGYELSWGEHVGLFALVVLAGVLGLVLLGCVATALVRVVRGSNPR
jgi:NADH:ubiquinone oxidoreductase subunit 2 (subunit N)